MTHTINLSDEEYEKLEELHRSSRDPSVKNLLESLLEKNNETKDGEIVYKEACNHFNKVKVEDYDLDFESNLQHQGEDSRFVCTNCWMVWDYTGKYIGDVVSEAEKESVLGEE